MAKLSDHQSSSFTKLLYIGDSGTGKTGSLASLVPDYDLRILDLDNGLDILKAFVKRDCPDRLDSIDFVTVRDKYKATLNGAVVDKAAAFTDSAKLMTKWEDDTIPSEWGPNTIFVLDSLTTLGKAALAWATNMNPSAKDGRQWYSAGQAGLENIIAMLTSDEFKANVIIISHISYSESMGDGPKGYPSSLGRALGPIIGRYFNNTVLAESSGTGVNVKRTIRLVPTDLIDLKTAAPFAFAERALPLESGLATIFATLRAN